MDHHSSIRPAPDEYASFNAAYVALVPDGDVLDLLAWQHEETRKLLGALPEAKAPHRYAAGKWSIKGVVGHVTDAERVFTYRALTIGRADATPLPGFDENLWAQGANFDDRTLKDLLEEYDLVRGATLALFRHLPAGAWSRRGTVNQQPASVRGLAWVTAGHERHHLKILQERYLK